MKICGNSNVNLIKLNQEKDSINFRAKIPVTVMNPINWKALSAATASLGIAGIALSKSNEEKKILLNNEEIISLINACKKDEQTYDLDKLAQTYIAISKTNPSDEQSTTIIPLVRALGNPQDWVTQYPLFASFLSDSISQSAYDDSSICKSILTDLGNVNPSCIFLYEKYLEDGYEIDKKNFSRLHDKAAFLSRLPWNYENFQNYSLETRNELINQVEKLIETNADEEDIENFTEIFQFCPEKLTHLTFNNFDKIKNIKNLQYKIESELRGIFEIIMNADISKKEQEIVLKHILSIAFISVFDPENYNNIINCPLYRDITKDKYYIPLLEDFDYEKPYNTIDFKKKVAEFENKQKNKFQDCELLNETEFHATKRELNSLPFNEDEIAEIIAYLDNPKDKEFMRDILLEKDWGIYLYNKEEGKKELIRFIKYASTNPEIIKKIQIKELLFTSTNSALKLADKFNNFDIIEKILNSSIPVEYLNVTFNNISENNIKYILEFIERGETFSEAKFNKLLVLKDFENPNNKSLEEIFNEIDIILKDTKQELNAQCPESIASLLNLKELHPETYKRIIESGYFEILENVKYHFLNENTDLNSNIYEDLEKVKNGESIIREFNNVSLQEAFNQSKCGDVVSIDNQLYINDGNSLIKWQMSKEKYLDLFPPVTRFATKQRGVGDCYLISSLSAIMQNPKARVILYQSFKEEGKDLYITIKGYEDYRGTIKIPNGVNPWKDDCKYNHLDGCKGLQLLEYAYAKTTLRKEIGMQNASVTDDIEDYTLMNRIEGGQNHITMSELLGLDFNIAKDTTNIEKKSIKLDIGDNSKIDESKLEEILEKYCNDENYILNIATFVEIPENSYNLSKRHAHTILGYDKINKIVLVENPHDCSIVSKVPLKDLYAYIDNLYITSLD